MDLIIRVKEIIGYCPVYKVGDIIVLEEGYKINPKKSSTICMHSLASIIPYHVALSEGVEPRPVEKINLKYPDGYSKCCLVLNQVHRN